MLLALGPLRLHLAHAKVLHKDVLLI